jgi:hypothetical protein
LIDWLHDQIGSRGLDSDWVNDAALAELANSSTHTGLTSHTALQVLLATASSDRVEIEDFEDVFYKQHASREADLARRPAQRRFFLPLDMKLQADLPRRPRVRVLNRNFTFLRLPSVLHQLGKEDKRILQNPQLREAHTGVAGEKVSQVFIAVSGTGPSWERAWDDVEPAFDALKGMIEVRSGLFGRRVFAPREQAWCALSPPPWALAKRPGLPDSLLASRPGVLYLPLHGRLPSGLDCLRSGDTSNGTHTSITGLSNTPWRTIGGSCGILDSFALNLHPGRLCR